MKRQARRELPYECVECGRDDVDLILDHIVPTAEGGRDEIGNAQWMCPPDHDDKTRREAARGRARRSRIRPERVHPAKAGPVQRPVRPRGETSPPWGAPPTVGIGPD